MKIGNLEVYGIIYKITNKINNKVYIGQTIKKNGFKGRYHYSGRGIERVYKYYLARNKSNYDSGNEYLLRSIEKYGFSSFEVCEVFDIAFSKEELNIKEKIWIQLYKSNIKKYGYNHQTGGDSHALNEETKNKMSIIAKKQYQNGRLPSFKGKRHTEESKEMIRISREGKCTGADNPNAKKVICLTTGEIFNYTLEGAKYYNCDNSNIIKACKDINKTCGKLPDETPLRWMYYDDYLNENNVINLELYSNVSGGVKIICLNDNKLFDSAKQASEYYKCDSSAIIKCCKNKQTHTHNLMFMYYEYYIKQEEIHI